MRVFDGTEYRDATPEEIAAWNEAAANQPASMPSPEERITKLEETKADQTDVNELHEALNMILTGVTE